MFHQKSIYTVVGYIQLQQHLFFFFNVIELFMN
jgi:hypothetical protein